MDASPVRLAHVLDSLALAIELGLGVPAQTVQRTAVIAARLARAADHDDEDVDDHGHEPGVDRQLGVET